MPEDNKPDVVNNEDRFDPYGFSEIEKIQQEIERDLSPIWMAPVEYPPAQVSEEATVDAFSEATIPQEDSTAFTPESVPTPVTTPLRETFYQETIKQPPLPVRRTAWRKTIVLVCLICTLGTGSLGFGLGLGMPLAQHYWLGGINNENRGDNANETPYGIESARYVFSDSSATTPRDGTLADIIKLVEPSVVSVASLFESGGNYYNTPQSGDASGIIFSEDAHKVFIATNNHVVSGATSVYVSIEGGTPLPAKLVGRDAESDLAVISIDKKDIVEAGINNIVIAVFGDSDNLEVGDVVLAIGNAMGEGNSATYGIISAKEKSIPVQNRTLTVLQTDAAINPGNSGGPLVNMRGEVIGINTAKLSDNYYSIEGMGYSISSNVVKPILEELMSITPKPFLGIQGVTVSDEVADQYSIPPIGVLVTGVFKGTGAEKAGIIRTDIITSFNGSSVFSMNQLAEEVKKCKVGDTVEVKILREGKEALSLQVKLGENNQDNF